MRTRRLAVIGGCAAGVILATWALRGGWRPAATDQRRSAVRLADTPVATRPTLWLLSIGVSHYKDSDISLQFADADARAVAAMLQQQTQGPIYREAKTLVLTNDQVSRESILSGIERFLGQAGPDDVAAIFMAGHGVQDRATGSYYFLPYPATAGNLLTDGLRMSDFDEMIRVLRRNVHRVVVMLDTCHAGALRLPSRALSAADDLATQVSGAEGLYLLAATKPGEESKETAELGHGAFTYAMIEGLRGAADSDGDGLVSVSDLFSYVARQVPRLTEGRQHPYHKIEGTDLPFAAVARSAEAAEPVAAEPIMARPSPEAAVTPVPNTIAVMQFRNLRKDLEQDWIGQALRAALDTELTKVRVLRVLSPDLIDRKRAEGLDELRSARQLGISKLLTGTFTVIGDTIHIDASIVDVASGVHEGSESAQGAAAEFFDLEKTIVLGLLRHLTVEVSPSEEQSIKEETNTTVNAYRLLLEAEGVSDEPTPRRTKLPTLRARGPVGVPQKSGASPTRKPEQHSAIGGSIFWGVAQAAETLPATTAAEVRAFLEEYRHTHEQKDLEHLAGLYVSFSTRQREAMRKYLDNAADLTVELLDVTIEPHEHDVTVSYTRRDRFIDRASGQPARLEVHLTKTLVREDGQWKIAGER